MSEQQWDGQWDSDHEVRAAELNYLMITAGQAPPEKRHKWVLITQRDVAIFSIATQIEVLRLTAMAALSKVASQGGLPEDLSLNLVLSTVFPKVGETSGDVVKAATELGTLGYHKLANACVQDLIRSVRTCRAGDDGSWPKMYAPPEPTVDGIGVPLTVVGIAAIAAITYYGVEDSKAVAAVAVEQAWAAARAMSEIKIAQMQIANGQKPVMSSWASARLKLAETTQASWFTYAALGLGGAAVVGAYLLTKPAPRANPRRRALPPPRKLAPPRPRPKQLGACHENPAKAEFVKEAMRGGATRTQANNLWAGYLRSTRSTAGRKGGRARARRRNPTAATRRPAVRPGSSRSLAKSRSASLPKRAKPVASKPKPRASSASRSSRKPVKVAKRAAKPSKRAVR